FRGRGGRSRALGSPQGRGGAVAVPTVLEAAGVTELTDELRRELVERAGNDFEAWENQVKGTGYCYHPIRLQGRIRQVDKASGEIREVYSTEHEPDRTLLVA